MLSLLEWFKKIKKENKMTEKLKQCPAEFQAISNTMMALHQASATMKSAVNDVLTAIEMATPLLQRDGVLIAEIHAKAILPLRTLALVDSQTRAIHYPLSEVVKRLGYELPVVLTRGPGGGR
jgi:hypothetical protein